MNSVVMAALLFCGALLQVLVPPARMLGDSAFPVLLALAVYFGLARRLGEALRGAFLAGILQDSLSHIPLGFSSLCFCTVVWTVHRFRNEVFIRDWITHLLFGASANFGVVLAQGIILWWMDLVRVSGMFFAWKLAGSLVLGAVTVPVIYQLAERLYAILGLDDQEQMA